MKTPNAKKIPHVIKQHGTERTDDYHWIRDNNWQKFIQGDLSFADQDVKTYIDEENAYTESIMADTESLQKELYEQMVSRINEDDTQAPRKHGDYYYYSRIEKGKDYRYHCRKKLSLDAPEEIIIDENVEAQGKGYYRIGALLRAKGDKYIALAENNTGSMEYSVRVKDLDSQTYLPWEISDSTGSICWCSDYEHLYYIERHPVNGRGQKIYRFNIHQGPDSKELIFDKPEELANLFMGINQSANGDYIFISLQDTNSNQIYYMSGTNPKAMPNLFHKIQKDTIVEADFRDGLFYLLSNEDGKINNQIFTCPEDKIQRENWELLIEHSNSLYIQFFDIYKDYFVYLTTNNAKALPELYIRNFKSNETTSVKMKDEAYDISYIGALEYQSPSIQFTYESPVRPYETQELTFATGEIQVVKEGKCPNFNPEDYQVERVFAPSHDGKEIPLTIVTKKGFVKDGSAKAFQYAYGSYGHAMPAYFSSNIFSLIDRGFSFSIAHIRGGSDKGYEWYLDGKMDKKVNTFKDYISCSEYLIEKGYSSKGNITANGGSAGGLLMGAISNMAPELYNSVILDVPFVDVVTTITDETLPLTPPEWNEWGNPITDAKAFNYMMSYSPYDNVAAKNYPHMLFNSGITDEQVTYWEPTKMVAKLRELKTDNNLLLLRLKMTAGHAGSSARYKKLEEVAFNYAFVLKCQELV
tara:strand:- start:15539 stop:17629 length:2091 start_codon:yes stop_codon:yes gene_type:complete